MTERSKFPELFLGLLALAVALAVAGWFAAKAIHDAKASDQVITVTGVATRRIRSDYAIWSFSVTGQGPTMQDAYKNVQTYTAGALAYLKTKQIAGNEITQSPLQSDNILEYDSQNQLTGRVLQYKLTENFEIRSSDVDGIYNLARDISKLIEQGIPISSQAPQFLYTQLPSLRISMLADATKDAKVRAGAIADATGNRIGVIRSVDVGLFQVTTPFSTDVSGEGQYDTTSIEKDVTVIESAGFQIQ